MMSIGEVVTLCILFTAFGFACGGMFEVGRQLRLVKREQRRRKS